MLSSVDSTSSVQAIHVMYNITLSPGMPKFQLFILQFGERKAIKKAYRILKKDPHHQLFAWCCVFGSVLKKDIIPLFLNWKYLEKWACYTCFPQHWFMIIHQIPHFKRNLKNKSQFTNKPQIQRACILRQHYRHKFDVFPTTLYLLSLCGTELVVWALNYTIKRKTKQRQLDGHSSFLAPGYCGSACTGLMHHA